MNIQQHIRQLSAALLLLGASQIHAADIEWADSAGNTTWTTSNVFNAAPASDSWVGGVAPANNSNTDTAIFTSVSNAQPNLTVQTRITGVDFQMAAGGLAMTGNNNLFQLGSGGINSSLQTSGLNTITNTRIFLNNSSTWNLFSSADTASTSTFTFDSTVFLNGQTLTVIGQRDGAAGNVGVINFDGAILGKTSDPVGSGTLTINSSSTNNTVNLNGVNTYTGVTNVNGGVVNVQNNQSAATGGWSIQSPSDGSKAATVNFSAGSTVAVAGANKIQIGPTANSGSHLASTLNVAGTVTNSGALQMERTSVLTLNNGAIWTQDGNLTLQARGGGPATLTVNTGADMTYSGSNNVQLSTGTAGSATLNINGTGRFTTAAGFENTNAVSTNSGVSRITLTDGGTLRLSAHVTDLTTQTQFALAGTGGVIDNNGFNATLSGSNTAGSSNQATGITGSGSLTSTGSGTLTLTGANTYEGATSVTGGTLLVNGSLAAASAVTVGEFGTLGGTGTIGGSLQFHAASGFHIADIDTPLTVGGSVTFGNGFGINNLSGIDWDSLALDNPYTLISSSQTFTASDIDNFGLANAAAVGTGRQAYFEDGSLQLMVIPEPSTLALLGISLATLAAFRRRRA